MKIFKMKQIPTLPYEIIEYIIILYFKSKSLKLGGIKSLLLASHQTYDSVIYFMKWNLKMDISHYISSRFNKCLYCLRPAFHVFYDKKYHVCRCCSYIYQISATAAKKEFPLLTMYDLRNLSYNQYTNQYKVPCRMYCRESVTTLYNTIYSPEMIQLHEDKMLKRQESKIALNQAKIDRKITLDARLLESFQELSDPLLGLCHAKSNPGYIKYIDSGVPKKYCATHLDNLVENTLQVANDPSTKLCRHLLLTRELLKVNLSLKNVMVRYLCNCYINENVGTVEHVVNNELCEHWFSKVLQLPELPKGYTRCISDCDKRRVLQEHEGEMPYYVRKVYFNDIA